LAQSHQQPVGLFAHSVGAHEALGIPDRLDMGAPLLEPRAEPGQRVDVAIVQPRALGEHPLVVRALEKVAGIRVGGFLERVALERVLERRHVQPRRRVRTPLQRARRHLEVAVGVRERVPQGVQDVAQVRAGLRLARIRPEHERQVLALDRRSAMQQEVGEQRLGAG
jgi:hypothetical protein